MDDGNGDQKINEVQPDVKQNCVENTNSLPPSSDNSVAKKTSFEITSITEPNNDDNDEDSPDTDSHIHDHRTETRHDSDLQNYADNMVVYNSSNDLGSSAPVIPTSSQYGLAIVDNSDSGHSLGSTKNEDIHGVDATSQKSDCDLNGLQNKNRNERFKVVKIESTEPFKRGRWVCMDFLDHSMNQQQPGNNKILMVNGDNKAFPQTNDLDSTEPLDNGHQECPEFRVTTNNVSTYTTNCNTSDNYKNQTSAYNIVSSGVTTPIHSACVSPGQSLQSNMQVPVLTSQPIATSVQAPQPQSLTQVQLPAQHNVNQGCIPHSSLQSHQIQQIIANANVIQPQLQQTQPVINVMQNQNQTIQAQSIQHINSVEQHVTQTMPQYQQPMSQANLQQQIMQQHSISAQFQKTFVPQNQSVLPNCAPLQPPVNQIINQQVPQYYNSPSIQSQNVSSESSATVPMSNQHINQPYQSIPIQNQPIQSHVQLQQNQQQLPTPVQQMQQPSPQQNMVQQNQMQPQMVQQNQQLSHQPSISQPSQPQQTQSVPQQTQQMSQQHIQQAQQTAQSQQTHVQQVTSSQQQGSQQMQQVGQQIQTPQSSQIQQQLPQQTHHITQISQMTNQSQQMSQSNQMQQQIAQPNQQIPQQPQQIPLQNQQIPQQAQLQHPKQMQTPQIQSQPQQINQQQISQQQQIGQIPGQNQMIHQNNQQIPHTGQMISQQTHSQGQQLNQQNQIQQQQQPQQQIQQQLTQTSQPSQSISQQILQPNQSMPQQNQVIPQQLGINQSNSQMSVPQSQNQQVIQPQQQQHMQQPGQQYQQPQQMMQSQPQQLPMQTNQPIMHQSTYSQSQSLSTMQLQQAVMQIPSNTVTSTQMHIQQQQPVGQSNMMQQPQINVMSQNNIQASIPMSQQQMTYSLQQHVPINQNYASMQSCYIPSQQQNMALYKPSMKTVETVNKKKEDTSSEDVDNGTTNSGTTTVAIDNKIEQAMDLVKSHLMYAVREEVEVLKEKIAELMDKVGQLETENSNLRMLVPPEMLEQYNREKQKPTNSQATHNQ